MVQKLTPVCVFLFYFEDLFSSRDERLKQIEVRVKSEFHKADFSPLAHKVNCPLIVTLDSQNLVEVSWRAF